MFVAHTYACNYHSKVGQVNVVHTLTIRLLVGHMNSVCISNTPAGLPQSQLAVTVTALIAEASSQFQKRFVEERPQNRRRQTCLHPNES